MRGKRPGQEGGAAAAVGRDGGGNSTPYSGREESGEGARRPTLAGMGSERRLPALVRAGKEVGSWPPFYVYVRGGMEVVRFFFNSLLFF
jgi:hypothetical protein